VIGAGRPTRLAVVCTLAFLGTGYLATTGVLWGEVAVVETLNALPDPAIAVLAFIMEIGTRPVILGVTAVVMVVAPGDWRRAGLAVAMAGLLAWALSDVAKQVVERPRPTAYTDALDVVHPASGFGWPSTHTSIATATLVAAALVCRRSPAAALVLAGVVGIGRMAVGVHFPVDVVGGALLGLAVATIAVACIDP
jgi:membrane-associated phospholipid phosphatase